MGVAFIAIAAVIALGGIFMCIWAGYQYMTTMLGPIQAALSAGLLLLIIASVIMWTAIKINR